MIENENISVMLLFEIVENRFDWYVSIHRIRMIQLCHCRFVQLCKSWILKPSHEPRCRVSGNYHLRKRHFNRIPVFNFSQLVKYDRIKVKQWIYHISDDFRMVE